MRCFCTLKGVGEGKSCARWLYLKIKENPKKPSYNASLGCSGAITSKFDTLVFAQGEESAPACGLFVAGNRIAAKREGVAACEISSLFQKVGES